MNTRRTLQQDAKAIASSRRFRAIVVATSGGLVQIRRLDQPNPDPTFYPARDGVAATLAAGDQVWCDADGSGVYVDYRYVTS